MTDLSADPEPPAARPVPAAELDAFIASRRGRRDGFVWGLGIVGGLFWVYVVGVMVVLWHYNGGPVGNPGRFWSGLATAVTGVVLHAAYLTRRRWSRWLLLVPPVASLIPLVAHLLGPGFHGGLQLLPVAVGEGALLLVPILAWRSPLNRLVFDLEVPRAELEAAYRAYRDNRTALLALSLALPAALVPLGCIPVAPVVLTAWRRSRQPGVGGRRTATAALLLLLVGAGVTVAVLVSGTVRL